MYTGALVENFTFAFLSACQSSLHRDASMLLTSFFLLVYASAFLSDLDCLQVHAIDVHFQRPSSRAVAIWCSFTVHSNQD